MAWGFIVSDGTDVESKTATQSAQGLMSAADKKKLDGIASGAQVNRTVTISTTDLTAGSSSLATGAIYLVYE